MPKYVNISATVTVLLDKNSKQNNGNIESITLTNTHSTAVRIASLHLDSVSRDDDYYIIKNVAIPSGVSLVLDDGIQFDIKKYSLKLTCDQTTGLSIIIK